MSNYLLETDKKYPFERIKVHTPQPIQGGSYLAKISLNDDPIIFQTPKCSTKRGIHKTDKKIYCDLLFTPEDLTFVDWLQNIETKVQQLIYEKRDLWFVEGDLSQEDIEYNWIDTVKNYKKNYLLRTFIPKIHKNVSIQVFDGEQNKLTIEDISVEDSLINIIELHALKFSSSSFHLEFSLRQCMIIKDKPIFNECLIKINNSKHLDNIDNNKKSESLLNNNEKIRIEKNEDEKEDNKDEYEEEENEEDNKDEEDEKGKDEEDEEEKNEEEKNEEDEKGKDEEDEEDNKDKEGKNELIKEQMENMANDLKNYMFHDTRMDIDFIDDKFDASFLYNYLTENDCLNTEYRERDSVPGDGDCLYHSVQKANNNAAIRVTRKNLLKYIHCFLDTYNSVFQVLCCFWVRFLSLLEPLLIF